MAKIECIKDREDALIPINKISYIHPDYWVFCDGHRCDIGTDAYKLLTELFEEKKMSSETTEECKIEAGQWYVCIKEINNFKVGDIYWFGHHSVLAVSEYFRPATEEETYVANMLADSAKSISNEPSDTEEEDKTPHRTIEPTEFEKEIDYCSKRFPEVSFAKMSRIAKRFYDLGKEEEHKHLQSEFDKEIEQAYKNQDEVVYNRGYDKGHEEGAKEVIELLDDFTSEDFCEYIQAKVLPFLKVAVSFDVVRFIEDLKRDLEEGE